MSTAAVISSSIYQELQSYFQQRNSDLQQLGQSLQSGDLAGAQQEFNAIQTLGQSGPFASGDPFKMSQREQAFQAIGQALQSGDLAGAQQAFAQLKSTFAHKHIEPQQPADPQPVEPTLDVIVTLSGASPASTSSTSASSNPASSSSGASDSTDASGATPVSYSGASPSEIVLNLGTVTPGEQITIGMSSNGGGGEQLTIGVAGQNQSPEQFTLNLGQSSAQQIILNLFNSATSSPAQSSSVNFSA